MKPSCAFLAFVSGWEFAALTTRRIPPWTTLVRGLPQPVKLGVVATTTAWYVQHMLKEISCSNSTSCPRGCTGCSSGVLQ